MKTLEEIKRETFSDSNFWKEIGTVESFNDEVARRFAIEVSKAALENAAKNVVIDPIYDYSLEVEELTGYRVRKSSITDERNIPKI